MWMTGIVLIFSLFLMQPVAYALEEAPYNSGILKNTPQKIASTKQLDKIGLTEKERAWLLAHPVIKVGVRTAFMPIEFYSEANRFRGITIDYMNRLEPILGVTFQKTDYETNPTTEMVDMVSAISNPNLLTKNGFIGLDKPLLSFPYAIYTASTNADINNFDDLGGKRVAIYKKGNMLQNLAKYPEIQVVPLNLAEDAFTALQENSVDAYVGSEIVVDYVSNIQGVNSIKKIGYTPYRSSIYMAVRNDWPELKSILQKTFLYLEPEKNDVLRRWDLVNDQKIKRLLQLALGGLLLVIAIILFRSYRLKEAIKAQDKLSQERIWHQANFDFLTNLPNRMMFHNRLEEEIKKANRSNLPLGLLFLDLDNFKQINDQIGHATGDKLIKEVAKRISGCVRSIDTIARIGGDEFTIIMGDLTGITAIENACYKILSRLEESFKIDDHDFFITASIGISVYPDDSHKIEDLVMYADQAMYEAKRLGRNRYQFFTASMHQISVNRHIITNDLRMALIKNEFVIFYQPIIDLNTGIISKAEALIRWHHPSKGLIMPGEFISIAEDTGMIDQLGDWVFEQVMQDVRALCKSHHANFQISINVSPRQFLNEANLLLWLGKLSKNGVTGDAIAIEITEGLLLQPSDSVKNILSQFVAANVEISIDDFGTGYSALGYLKKFNVDYVKLDRSFIQNLELDHDTMVLCEAIIDMAQRLKIKVVAEGIETAAQQMLLKQFGCDYGQGFLFAAAAPLDKFQEFLANPRINS